MSGFDPKQALSRRCVRWALVVGLWTFWSTLFTVDLYIGERVKGNEISLLTAELWHLGWGVTWMLFTGVILWLRRRFPLDEGRWQSNLWLHIPVSLVMAFIGGMNFVVAGQLLGYYPPGVAFTLQKGSLFFATWLHLDPFLYWLIIGLAYSAQYYRESRERQIKAAQLETQLTQARLQALEMQLHPHFLFNALHTIAVLVRTDRNAQAVRVVTGLGELLRRVLDGAGAQLVPLKQEIEFIRRYLEIEQIRFGDRLNVEMRIEPGSQEAQVPYLILQPLVENAIQHGIAPRASAGTLRIAAWRDGDRLHLSVWDDGPGLPETLESATGDGLGLSTTKERLEQLYGDDHGFVVENAKDGGVAAVLDLPFQLAVEELGGSA
ncbi:MAG: histidine kinase [Gemmatimonadota bacterium]|nr:MAG: histidine kinase [Gemmatimonadota bacterium]